MGHCVGDLIVRILFILFEHKVQGNQWLLVLSIERKPVLKLVLWKSRLLRFQGMSYLSLPWRTTLVHCLVPMSSVIGQLGHCLYGINRLYMYHQIWADTKGFWMNLIYFHMYNTQTTDTTVIKKTPFVFLGAAGQFSYSSQSDIWYYIIYIWSFKLWQ